ncbi:MAG: hypothetical protein A2075_11055 [Geobacteraceae bacterium GWC2_58_44]|nr:MAG: hypothetical protein A2075_11055 [Geobacteraceae bacterium GWC2_58_44]HBG07991.1 hypothetical protein [Geobacter sp.]
MSKRRKLCLYPLVLLIIVASVTWSFCLAYATSCTCKDICSIENVATEARAAQWEYQIQIARLQSEDYDSFMSTWYTPGRYEEIQMDVQKRINSHSARSECSTLDSVAATTNGGDCSITTEATTACIKEYGMAHERVHQRACQSFSHILTYQMSYSLADMLAEEIAGYQTAIDMERWMKNGPLKDCCCLNRCTSTTNGTPVTGALPKISTLQQIVRNLVR